MSSSRSHRSKFRKPHVIAAVSICCVLAIGGCHAVKRPLIESANFAQPLPTPASQLDPDARTVESIYAEAVRLDQSDDTSCLDAYLNCCHATWQLITNDNGGAAQNGLTATNVRALELYRSSVGRLIESAQRLGRFDPEAGIQTNSAQVVLRLYGAGWHPSELRRYVPIGDYEPPRGMKAQSQPGLGVPLLAFRESNRPYIQAEAAESFTAVVRPGAMPDEWSLDIINPYLIREANVAGRRLPLAFDLTAPMVYYDRQYRRVGQLGFLRPGEQETENGLAMVHPYQPGKIPLVFVHGLASDPMTWGNLANELFIDQDLMQRFQFWLFSYPTGDPFPIEAARLRQQLVQLRDHIDPSHSDRALDNIIMIGHSMGGLMAKLQTTTSGDRLARAVFAKPVDELNLTPEMRRRIENTFFFEPSSQIRRVVFIGTPHRGSRLASNPVGRLASGMVRTPQEMASMLEDMTSLNGGVFLNGSSELPTSVDLLRPENQLLQAIYSLPVNPQVKLHNLIGNARGGSLGRPSSDGVVTVSSARHRDTNSELLIDATHQKLHSHPNAVAELRRILREHVQAYDDATRHQQPIQSSR